MTEPTPTMFRVLFLTRELYKLIASPVPASEERVHVAVADRLCREALALFPQIESTVPPDQIATLRNALGYIEPVVAKMLQQTGLLTR